MTLGEWFWPRFLTSKIGNLEGVPNSDHLNSGLHGQVPHGRPPLLGEDPTGTLPLLPTKVRKSSTKQATGVGVWWAWSRKGTSHPQSLRLSVLFCKTRSGKTASSPSLLYRQNYPLNLKPSRKGHKSLVGWNPEPFSLTAAHPESTNRAFLRPPSRK